MAYIPIHLTVQKYSIYQSVGVGRQAKFFKPSASAIWQDLWCPFG